MRYIHYKIIIANSKKHLLFDSAATGGTDQTTDSTIVNNPNDFLAPRADGKINTIETLVIIALIIGIGLLTFSFIKQAKNFL